jgi:protein N-lysine methyltransferase METTL21A
MTHVLATQTKETKTMVIPVGELSVRMSAPLAAEEIPERLSFWWGITSAAVALARGLESAGGLSGESVMELGCGTGLAGVTAGLLGAHVTFTDYVEDALTFARTNSLLNGLNESATRYCVLDWENPKDHGVFDLVLGAEVVYDYFFHGCLLLLLERLVSPNGRVMLADRKRLCVSRFIGRMISRGFICEQASSHVALDGFPHQEITIFTLRRQVL